MLLLLIYFRFVLGDEDFTLDVNLGLDNYFFKRIENPCDKDEFLLICHSKKCSYYWLGNIDFVSFERNRDIDYLAKHVSSHGEYYTKEVEYDFQYYFFVYSKNNETEFRMEYSCKDVDSQIIIFISLVVLLIGLILVLSASICFLAGQGVCFLRGLLKNRSGIGEEDDFTGSINSAPGEKIFRNREKERLCDDFIVIDNYADDPIVHTQSGKSKIVNVRE